MKLTDRQYELFSEGYWAFYNNGMEPLWWELPKKEVPRNKISWTKGYRRASKDFIHDRAANFFRDLEKLYNKYRIRQCYPSVYYDIEIGERKYMFTKEDIMENMLDE